MKVVASIRAAALGPPSGAAMADVNRELVEVITDEWWGRVDGASITRLIALTDAMLEELELLNLADVAPVSAEWQERLVVLLASLPFEYRPRLRTFPSPTEVLDMIFDIQGSCSLCATTAGRWNGSSPVRTRCAIHMQSR